MENFSRQKVIEAIKEYYKEISARKNEMDYIPPSGKMLDEDDLINMVEASLDMWLTTGRFNDCFEKELSRYLDVKYALSVNSGSSANLLAISALTSHKLGEKRLKKGDEVITIAAGFPTTINPIIQNGLIPVFVDCELDTCNIDTNKIEQAITPKTKAIILAHTLGNMFNIEKVMQICEKYNLWLIEDSCDALGSEYEGKKAGTFGHIGTFSFYPAHHITMGEGGAVVTNDKNLYDIIKSFRDWGRDCSCETGHDNKCGKRFNQQFGNLPFGYDHKYVYSHIGFNMKITDIQAALGVSQLKKLPMFLEKRTKNAQYLLSKLQDLSEFLILPKSVEGVTSSWFGFLISVKPHNKFSKQEIVEFLEKNGVGTRQLFSGNILRQPMFVENDITLRIENSGLLNSKELKEEHYKLLPNTDFIMNNTFWIGVFPRLEEKHLDKISDLIHTYFQK